MPPSDLDPALLVRARAVLGCPPEPQGQSPQCAVADCICGQVAAFAAAEVQDAARHDMNAEAIYEVRRIALAATGGNCTFVDDDMALIAALAQRAVLAGLVNDARPFMQIRLSAAAEKDRAMHEATLGYPIEIDWRRELQLGRRARRDLYGLKRQLDEAGIIRVFHGDEAYFAWLSAADPTGDEVQLVGPDKEGIFYVISNEDIRDAHHGLPLRSLEKMRVVEPK